VSRECARERDARRFARCRCALARSVLQRALRTRAVDIETQLALRMAVRSDACGQQESRRFVQNDTHTIIQGSANAREMLATRASAAK
jgi:hypothetical protein